MDLSWPPGGVSVNDGIAKDQFMGFHRVLKFPTIDIMAKRVFELGNTAQMFKVDLSRFFRQIPLDPGEYSLMCFTWGGKIWFDLVSPMGLRTAPAFAQRISDALKYIHNQMGFFLFNYIDDFLGAELPDQINSSFLAFKRTLRDLNVMQSTEKEVPPTQEIDCIGVLVSAHDLTLRVTPERLQALWVELNSWLGRTTATLRDLQVLIGKLQFVCACVKPGRLFLSRILRVLKKSPSHVELTEDFKKDILWWIKYLPLYNGISMIWMEDLQCSDMELCTDACLQGLGGTLAGKYYSVQLADYSDVIDPEYSIVHLELLAVLIAFKLWSIVLKGHKVLIKCDNAAVVRVLNSGRADCPKLQKLMRELVFVAATEEIEFYSQHIMGKNNVLSDILSRANKKWARDKFLRLNKNLKLTRSHVHSSQFLLLHDW